MTKLIWRVKFAFTVREIFSKPKGVFKGNHFTLGWRVSGNKYAQYKHMEPRAAALTEIEDWYDL